MRITLGRRGDYAVRAVLDLAHAYGSGRRKTREIAESMQIPATYLPQILAELVGAGALTAVAGKSGGYELSRPPDEITLLDVVELIDGPIQSSRCLLRGIPCGSDGYCAVHDAWSDAQEALRERLARTTFAELVRRDSLLDSRSIGRPADAVIP